MQRMQDSISELTPNQEFAKLANDEQIERTARALESNGIQAVIAETAEEAKRIFFELVPAGAEVFLGASVTLETLGIKDEIDKSGRFDALRTKMFAMDRATQGREIRKLGGAPDYAAGSVHAVTENGEVLIASKTGSQLGPYASGAGKVIWIVGAQKLVKDFNEGFRRIREYCYPLEEVHMQQLYKTGTSINKVLIVNNEIRPDRITMIIVKEQLGF
ncbi:MAG TPA: LUD domain-containing protein [Anaerolineales bacterium]|nr:LUD domain-containing protein [Anaerolineales bacterium]